MLGGLALKWNWRKRQRAQGKSIDAPNLIMGPCRSAGTSSAVTSTSKSAKSHWKANASCSLRMKFSSAATKHHLASSSLSAVTFTLQFRACPRDQPCPRQAACRDRTRHPHPRRRSQRRLPRALHPADLLWDFRLPRVKSINASGHKFGLAPLGVGWALWRERHDLPEDLIFDVNYLGGNMPTFALNFSRARRRNRMPVLQLPAPRQRGLPRHPNRVLCPRPLSRGKDREFGPFKIIYDGDGGIPGLCWN